MVIAIHWDWEGHSTLKPLQSSCTVTLLAPHTADACELFKFSQFLFSNTEQAFENLHHSKISPYTVDKHTAYVYTHIHM